MLSQDDREAFTEGLRRRRGRPRAAVRKVRTSVYIPEGVFDAYSRLAAIERESLNVILSRALEVAIREFRS